MSKVLINIHSAIGSEEDYAGFTEMMGEEINFFSAKNMEDFLNEEATKAADTIVVDIESPGGDVVEGLAIYDMLREQRMNGKKVKTIGRQFDSIASIIMLAGSERIAHKGAEPLIHNAWLSPVDLDPDMELNSQTLAMIKETNDIADGQILAIYAENAGRDKAGELKEIMMNSTKLSDEQILGYGFAYELVSGGEKKALRALAFNGNVIKNLKEDTMSKEVVTREEFQTGLDKLVDKLKGLFSAKRKNMLVELADGSSVYVDVAEGEDPVGAAAYMVEDGIPTEQPAAAGEYPIASGGSIVIGEGGMVESAEMPVPSAEEDEDYPSKEMQALKNELEAAKKLAADLQAQLDAQKAEAVEQQKETEKVMAGVMAEIKALKNSVIGDHDPANELERKMKASSELRKKVAEMKPSERRLYMKKLEAQKF